MDGCKSQIGYTLLTIRDEVIKCQSLKFRIKKNQYKINHYDVSNIGLTC